MTGKSCRQCQCGICRKPDLHPTKELHAQLNEFLDSLNEPMRLAFLGRESMNAAYGGDQELELITGVPARVIAKLRFQIEMAEVNGYRSVGLRPEMLKAKLASTAVNHDSPAPNYVVGMHLVKARPRDAGTAGNRDRQ